MTTNDTTFEKHYSIAQLVELWGYSTATIRRLVMLEPDVPKTVGPNGKRTYRIPESVARRIHTKLMAPQRSNAQPLTRPTINQRKRTGEQLQ